MEWKPTKDNAPTVSINENGELEISVGSTVIIKTVEEWHKMAKDDIYACESPSRSDSDSFYRQQSYLSSLIEVASRTDHKLHDEIDEAVKKLKELTYA